MVIVIIGILAAIAVPKFVSLREEAQKARCESDVGAIRTALSNWYATYQTKCDSTYPGGTDYTVCNVTLSSAQGFPLNTQLSDQTSVFGSEYFTEQSLPPTTHIYTTGAAAQDWDNWYHNTTGAMTQSSYCGQ